MIENLGRARRFDGDDRNIEAEPGGEIGEQSPIGEHEKGRADRGAMEPRLQGQFRTDSGRIAHRHGERA
jgi:hypothetical protein